MKEFTNLAIITAKRDDSTRRDVFVRARDATIVDDNPTAKTVHLDARRSRRSAWTGLPFFLSAIPFAILGTTMLRDWQPSNCNNGPEFCGFGDFIKGIVMVGSIVFSLALLGTGTTFTILGLVRRGDEAEPDSSLITLRPAPTN